MKTDVKRGSASWLESVIMFQGGLLMRILCLGFFIALNSSSPLAADQQTEARALEPLFSNQSSVEFINVDGHQEISPSVDGCKFTLRNEQHLPLRSAQKSYVESSVFNLTILNTSADQVEKNPNQKTMSVSWHAMPEVFKSALQISLRLTETGAKARQDLNRSKKHGRAGRDRLQALADMSRELWEDALAGPDGQYLQANYQMRESMDRVHDPRRAFGPFLGFRLHVKPDDADGMIAALHHYKESWCNA